MTRPGNPVWTRECADAYARKDALLVGRTAEHRAREATDLRTALLGSAHPDVAADLAVVAAALFEQQRHEEAEPLFQRPRNLRRPLRTRPP